MTKAAPPRTPDEVLDAARARTDLEELDSDTWREGLDVLLDALADPAVHDAGRELVTGQCVDALANRLRVHAYVQSHPEVLDERIERPLVVLGMPRTGTTVASYLLAQDPSRRSLLKWEAADSAPPATTATLRTDPRCLAMLEAERQELAWFSETGVVLPHWEDADGPTECIYLHQQDFKALLWDALTPSSTYADWLLDEADPTSAYEYEQRVLQVLQSRAPGVWNLKMPSHALHLDALLTAFPDARVVWAHRDPYKVTGSLCNLHRVAMSMVTDPAQLDPSAIAANARRQLQEHVARPMRVRERIGDEAFFDLHYADVMRDPIGQMRALYEWAGDDLTPETETRMVSWLADNPQDKHGVNRYRLEEYGLTVADLEPDFGEYLATFDVELEGDA